MAGSTDTRRPADRPGLGLAGRVAWLLFALTLACVVAETIILASYRPLLSTQTFAHGWPLISAAVLGGSFMGALIVSRYPRHRIGWLLCAGQTGAAVGLVTEAYGVRVLSTHEWASDGLGHRALWVSVIFGASYAVSLVSALFLLAPHGSLASRRWWPALALCGLAPVTYAAGIATVDPGSIRANLSADLGRLSTVLLDVGLLMTLAAVSLAALSLIRRTRRAEGEVRQQLRWIAASAGALAVTLTLLLVGDAFVDREPNPVWLVTPAYLAYASLPVSTGVAVLRYRLYDIDLIINRATLLACGSAFAAIGYVALVVTAGRAADPGGFGFWSALAVLAVVAVAFQPFRARAVRFADRLAYGPRAAPYETLAELSSRLGEHPASGKLLPAAAEAAARAVSAHAARAVLAVPGGGELTATWPAGAAGGWSGLAVPVTDRGHPLGRLELLLTAGRPLRAGDRRLLADLADQAALAFRNAALEAQLTARVETLRARTVELAASRLRLIEAQDAERRRLATLIRGEVLPHLDAMPARLDQLAAGGRPDPDAVEALVGCTTAALDRLREVTRETRAPRGAAGR